MPGVHSYQKAPMRPQGTIPTDCVAELARRAGRETGSAAASRKPQKTASLFFVWDEHPLTSRLHVGINLDALYNKLPFVALAELECCCWQLALEARAISFHQWKSVAKAFLIRVHPR